MPGLCFSNELISRNEGLHCDFACLLYSKLINKLPESHIVEIIISAVEIKMKFIVDALPVELIGMNLGMMCNYIRFCTDRRLLSLGCGHHYKIGNPSEWMEMISREASWGKTKSGVGIDRADQSFALDASFCDTNGMMTHTTSKNCTVRKCIYLKHFLLSRLYENEQQNIQSHRIP